MGFGKKAYALKVEHRNRALGFRLRNVMPYERRRRTGWLKLLTARLPRDGEWPLDG